MRRLLLLAAAGLLACCAARAAEGDDRDLGVYNQWLPAHRLEVLAFETYLARQKVADVAPTYQLLRTASMWRECKAPPFQLPPAGQWAAAADVLRLLRELRRVNALVPFEVVSAYRDERLNRCAGGSRRSSHMRFAVDLLPLVPGEDEKLCAFWRDRGKEWKMGLSRYPSGRIHVDRSAWRTWGSDYSNRTSFCSGFAQALPDKHRGRRSD
jgi:hypothetical protein